MDWALRKPLLRGVVRKLVTIEPRQSFARGKPEKPSRVAHDAIYAIARQAISGCIKFQRQLFGKRQSRKKADEKQCRQQSGRQRSSEALVRRHTSPQIAALHGLG